VPLFAEFDILLRLHIPAWAPIGLVFLIFVIATLAAFEKTQFTHVLIGLYAAFGVPWALSCLTRLRGLLESTVGGWLAVMNEPKEFEQNLVVFFLFFCFCCAWLTDTCAYFAGVKLGKHKLCPKISPKKTVEGAIGGIVGTAVLNTCFALLFNAFFLHEVKVNVWAIALFSVPLSIVSMIGDLTASIYKRNFGEKDYGKLFPGHGGVMDRFDSLVFVAPAIYAPVYFTVIHGLDLFFVLANP